MSVRKKTVILTFLVLINAVGSGALTVYIDQRFIWPAIVLPVLFGLFLVTLRCNRCGKLVYKNNAKLQGLTFRHSGWPVLPGKCAQCGLDFGDQVATTPL